MVANTGTYVDIPIFDFASGKSLAELPLESLAELPAVVGRPIGRPRAIGAAHFEKIACAGCAGSVETGWSRHRATKDYFGGHPYLH